MYIVPTLLVVPLVVAFALPGGIHISQSMNHMSFPGENHKPDSFYHHVLLTDKMYSIDVMPW